MGNDLTSNFGTEVDHAVVGDLISCGSEAISVESGTNEVSVAEGDICWAVPRFLQGGMVFIEIDNFLFVGNGGLALVSFWHDHHHCLEWREATLNVELQQVVESVRVTTGGVENWLNLIHEAL